MATSWVDSVKVSNSPAALQLTKMALLVRLVCLFAALTVTLGEPRTKWFMVGVLLLGASSYVGLASPRVLQLIARHPALALVDVVVMLGAVVVTGVDGPLVLGSLTTAILVGLWIAERFSVVVVVCMVGLYAVALQMDGRTEIRFNDAVLMPLTFILLWLVGVIVRRALLAELQSQVALSDAITLAAAADERARFAREIHDSLAKSLQGISLSAAALPRWVESSPEVAVDKAQIVAVAAAQAVDDARSLMTNIRRTTSREPLPSMVKMVTEAWRRRTGGRVVLDVADVDIADDSHRYELLAALGEALENVSRHAGRCTTTVSLSGLGDQIMLTVADDGVGAAPGVVSAAQKDGHFGVKGMHERLAQIGGMATWESTPGKGTTVRLLAHREGLVEK